MISSPVPLLFSSRSVDGVDLPAMRAAFRRLKYNEESIGELLGVGDTYEANADPLFVWSWALVALRGSSRLATLVRIFLLGLRVPEAHVRRCFSRAEFRSLERLGLIEPADRGEWRSPIALYPRGPHLIATDRISGGPMEGSCHRVMYLGADSYGLARIAGPRGGRSAIDLCTGSGVSAIAMAERCDEVVGIDINPRAVSFARFNAALNGLRNCRFEEGDLYDAVPRATFDVITANPPFVPSPRVEVLFRDGGPSGEDVLARIVAGYPSRARPGALLQIVTDAVEHEGRPYVDKVAAWIERPRGFVGAVLPSWRTLRPIDYAASHAGCTPADEGEIARWLDAYRAERIAAITPETFIVVKCAGNAPTRIVRARPASLPRDEDALRLAAYVDALADAPVRAAADAEIQVTARIGASVSIAPRTFARELPVPLALALAPHSPAEIDRLMASNATPRQGRRRRGALAAALSALSALGHAEQGRREVPRATPK